MANIEVSMNLTQRPAKYTLNCNRPELDLKKGDVVNVGVFGLYQVQFADEVDAYFVVELPNGKCTYTSVTTIQFTDTGVE